MTTREALMSVNNYPIPNRTLQEVAARRGVDLDAEATTEDLLGKDYNLAFADLLTWLSFAPDVSQGGQSYSFTDEQRQQFRNKANSLYEQFDDEVANKILYGYKGSNL